MALPLPSGVDLAKVMEILHSLPPESQEELLKEDFGSTDHKKQPNPQDELVQRFTKLRARFFRPGEYFAEQIMRGEIPSDAVQVGFSNDADIKPKSDMKSLHKLKPMIGKELGIGTTHCGRYLCGWVAIDDAFFGAASTSLLLQDVTGYLVEIAVYGLFSPELNRSKRQIILASRFPKGKPIIVIEPYYKLRTDLTLGIRIDNVQELIPWKDVPTDLSSWKQLGNEFFGLLNTQNGGCGALACYQRAIESVKPEICTIAMLFNNMATCRYKANDYTSSIQLSGAAVHLDPVYFKAWYRLASALAEYERKGQNEDRESHPLVVRVVTSARSVLPNLTPQEQQILENILLKYGKLTTRDDFSKFQSYAEWCVVMESINCFSAENNSFFFDDADDWRKKGSSNFAKGDVKTAEECYRKGLVASTNCCREVSLLLNNIAAVHLMLYRETRDVPGISVSGSSSFTAENVIPATEAALLNCTVAGILDPLNHKAWSRRSRCLGYLGFKDEKCMSDMQVIRSNVLKSASHTQNNERVQEFNKKMAASIELKESKVSYQVSDVPTNVQREERDFLRPENYAGKENSFCGENDMDIDTYIAQMEGFNKVTRLAYTFRANSTTQELPREMMMYLNNPPPKIHVEFPKLRGWPTGIDSEFARKVLYRAFLNARCSPWIKAYSMRTGDFWKHMNPADLIKRWHGMGAMQVIRSKHELKFGDIIDGREAMGEFLPAYDARIRSNFANNPNRSEIYFFGTTHVAIGFNDLSSLLSATLRNESNNEEVLRFVGFEMSEFAVAKCKVVAQMLKSSEISLSSVLEVWLSSTWNETTLMDFRKSVRVVLLDSLRGEKENKKVVLYLQHWSSAEPISATKARSEFFLNMERYNRKQFSASCSFHREIDRLYLIRYLLSGEIHTTSSILNLMKKEEIDPNNGETTGKGTKSCRKKKKNVKNSVEMNSASTSLVGSITIWNVPSGAPPLEEDIALNIVDFMSLLEDFTKREKKQKGSTARLSVVDLFIIHILQNLEHLRTLLMTNKLTIEVYYGVIKAVRGETVNDVENQRLLQRIAMLRPYTISWSNVLDYFTPEDFHDLARRCSIHGDCMHYGYSMNWTTQVYGASIIDYDLDECKELINGLLDLALGFPSSLKSSSTRPIPNMFTVAGLDKLLTLPFRENPLNSTGYILANSYKKNWIDYFMNAGELTSKAGQSLGVLSTPTNCGLQRGSMELAMPSPLYRTSLTLYMSWCYDPQLRLQAANNVFDSNNEEMLVQ